MAIEKPKPQVKKDIKTEDLIHWFKFYILPILSIFFLLVILLIGIYPNLKTLFGYLDEIDKMEKQSTALGTQLSKLKELNKNESRTQAYLSLIETIVPTKETEVVNFQEKIKILGTNNGLRLVESKTGETIIIPEDLEEGEVPGVGLIEVPSQFSFQGELDDIKTFLGELNEGEDFLVINEMKLTSINSVVSDQWTLDITFVKYQFQEMDLTENDPFSEVSEGSKPNEDVLNFIKDRYGKGNPLLELND